MYQLANKGNNEVKKLLPNNWTNIKYMDGENYLVKFTSSTTVQIKLLK
jgi:hypothetical protein